MQTRRLRARRAITPLQFELLTMARCCLAGGLLEE
jgi:hypothetical protein